MEARVNLLHGLYTTKAEVRMIGKTNFSFQTLLVNHVGSDAGSRDSEVSR
jgi:hypothetical protein